MCRPQLQMMTLAPAAIAEESRESPSTSQRLDVPEAPTSVSLMSPS